MRSSRIEKRFAPNDYLKMSRKQKKKIKKILFGFYYSSNFHGIYRYEKYCCKDIKSVNKVIRRGRFIWMQDTISKNYWKILHIYK